EFLRALGEQFIFDRRRLLSDLPSWAELAKADVRPLLAIPDGSNGMQPLPPQLDSWLTELRLRLHKAAAEARSFLAIAEHLAQASEHFASSIDMRLLYDHHRR